MLGVDLFIDKLFPGEGGETDVLDNWLFFLFF